MSDLTCGRLCCYPLCIGEITSTDRSCRACIGKQTV